MQEAQVAKEQTQGYKLDRSHIFAVKMFDDFERSMNVREEWEAPQTQPEVMYLSTASGLRSVDGYQLIIENLQKWLTDEKARDQLVIRSGPDTEVLWNDAKKKKPEPVHKCTYWTESYVQWPPLGTYLVTLHKQGAAVWGGADSFALLMRYQHNMVKLVDFPPGEKYLVTYHSQEPSNPRDASKVEVKVFDVRTGKMMRYFKGSARRVFN
ncbi:unnamed protein product [Arabis nemorensis]|uniref:Uncharacterized protein n=1 Tax=Arabis nemorensis TaxID=586526 RepID=A0A565BTY6_9BRAS|nr:unnamed protein product [Arabis nemorensis]